MRKPSWCCVVVMRSLPFLEVTMRWTVEVDCLAGDETLLQRIHRWHWPHSDWSQHHSIMRWITCVEPFIYHVVRGQSNSVMGWISAQFCLKKAGVTLPSDCRVVCCSCTSCCWASLSLLMEYLLELGQCDSMTACMVTPDSVITPEQQTQYLMLSQRPRDSH